MKVDIYADVACPWCYIGAVRFDRALQSWGERDRVEVTYQPFQLDPNAPQQAEPMMRHLARRFGAQADAMVARVKEIARTDGLVLDYERGLTVNTLQSHRLMHLALEEYGSATQRALALRLYRAHFSEGLDVSDYDVLSTLAADVGMKEALARDYLLSGDDTRDISDQIDAARAAGITAVPTFIFDDKYMIEGAQPVEGFVQAFEVIARETV